jgi:FtsZ-binding cell division protein ZapB
VAARPPVTTGEDPVNPPRFKVVTPFASNDATRVIPAGEVVTTEDLKHADVPWLLKCGAIVPDGYDVDRLGVSLLGDDPTPGQYQDEIARLQLILEEVGTENDRLRDEVDRLKVRQFPAGDRAHAADNAGRKIKEAEDRATALEAEVARLTFDGNDLRSRLAKVTEERDKLSDRFARMKPAPQGQIPPKE